MPKTPTSTAFTGGLVWTTGYRTPRPLDVLVDGDHIVEVAARGRLSSPAAQVVDLAGRLLMSGFQDAHAHLGIGGRDLLTCDLSSATTSEQVYAMISDYAAAHPDLPWIEAAGWNRELFPYPAGPTRLKLDALVGGRPACMVPFDRHGAWVNSAALARAGITVDTPDPEGGRIGRAADGSLSGMVEENAVQLIRAVLPEVSTEDHMRAILRAQNHLVAMGITSVQDALVGTGMGLVDSLEAFRRLLVDDQLHIRLTAALWWDAGRGVEQVEELIERRRVLEGAAGPDRVIADTVKMMIDGSGLLFMDADQVRDATVAADRAGFAVHYHSYGDASTRSILDAIEAAVELNGPRERRHHIAHLFVVDDLDFARFARLGVTANVQGFWVGSGVPHEHLGHSSTVDHPENLEYPVGRMQAAGARLAAGSDWPVTTSDPLLCSVTATGRYADDAERKQLDPTDRLDLSAMLDAYTTGSAFVNGRAATTGRIAPGYLADLVVLDRDLLADGADVVGAVVEQVWIGGRPVHQRAEGAA